MINLFFIDLLRISFLFLFGILEIYKFILKFEKKKIQN